MKVIGVTKKIFTQDLEELKICFVIELLFMKTNIKTQTCGVLKICFFIDILINGLKISNIRKAWLLLLAVKTAVTAAVTDITGVNCQRC